MAAPAIVYFGVEPADKAAVATHVTLTSTPAEGGVGVDPARRRPVGFGLPDQGVLAAGTRVHMSAQLYGVELAPGAYGAADITSDFTAPVTAPANTLIPVSSGQPIAARGDGGDSFDAVSAAASAA